MYAAYIMRRTQIYLDEEQEQALAARASATARTKSALIREAIDAFLSAPEREDAELARFRDAVRAAAGVAPYLPDGRTYVEQLRAGDSERAGVLDQHWRE